MAPLGIYQLSGVLYAGCDFEEWETQTEAFLKVHSLRNIRATLSNWRSPVDVSIPSLILSRVDQAILSRIPDEILSEGQGIHAQTLAHIDLYAHLYQQSRPFRFMDLPVEIRTEIYKLIPGMSGVRTWDRDAYTPRQGLPSVLAVSSAVRRETIPLFCSLTTFCNTERFRSCFYSLEDLSAGLEDWTKTFPPGALQHLRACDIYLSDEPEFGRVQFEFSPTTGLEISHDAISHDAKEMWALDFKSECILQKAVDRIEKYRRVASLQGEAIPMLLLEAIELAQNNELKWEAPP